MTDLGEQPAPEIEPAEPPPGGVDAVDESLYEPAPVVPDLTRVGNERDVPDEVTQPDAIETAATRGEADQSTEESPA